MVSLSEKEARVIEQHNLSFFQFPTGDSEDKAHVVALMGIEPMFQP